MRSCLAPRMHIYSYVGPLNGRFGDARPALDPCRRVPLPLATFFFIRVHADSCWRASPPLMAAPPLASLLPLTPSTPSAPPFRPRAPRPPSWIEGASLVAPGEFRETGGTSPYVRHVRNVMPLL